MDLDMHGRYRLCLWAGIQQGEEGTTAEAREHDIQTKPGTKTEI